MPQGLTGSLRQRLSLVLSKIENLPNMKTHTTQIQIYSGFNVRSNKGIPIKLVNSKSSPAPNEYHFIGLVAP